VRHGGFGFALGLENEPGVPPPAESMRLLGKSDFGSSFLIAENISEARTAKHHHRLMRHSLNWNPEDMSYGLHLIAISIHNIVSYLKIRNGISAEQVQFLWPTDEDLYHEPWKRSRSIGINRISWPEYQITEDQIEPYSKEDILSIFARKAD
jgi:hypothetical protein